MEDNRKTHNVIKLIFATGIVTSFVVISIMFGWEATRRSAEDVVKIKDKPEVSFDRCAQLKGKSLQDIDGKYLGCKIN